MVNIWAFVKALKLSWIRRIIMNEGKWLTIFKHNINFEKLFSLGTKYIEQQLANMNLF